MAIKEITAAKLGKAKTGWVWDRKREIFFTFQVDTQFNGERYVRRGFKSAKDAEEHIEKLKMQERLHEIGFAKPLKFPTVKSLFDKYLATIAVKRDHTTADRVCKLFLSKLPAGIKINELVRKHFKDYCDLRFKENVKPATVFREITYLSSPLHSAGDFFEGLENWKPPENLIYRPEVPDGGRERVVTADERRAVIEYLFREREPGEEEKEYRARIRTGLIVWFAPLTGLRHGEIAALKKSNFFRAARRLVAERFKTSRKKGGISRTVFEPLTETHLHVLDEAAKLYPDGEYFFSAAGRIHGKTYSILEAACDELKIPYGKNTPGGFVIHDLRHTFVTILEHASVDSSTTRSFSGHSKEGMMKHYAHATADSRARAMQVIENEIRLNDGGQAEADLKELFDDAANGKIAFEDFKNRLRFVYGYFA